MNFVTTSWLSAANVVRTAPGDPGPVTWATSTSPTFALSTTTSHVMMNGAVHGVELLGQVRPTYFTSAVSFGLFVVVVVVVEPFVPTSVVLEHAVATAAEANSRLARRARGRMGGGGGRIDTMPQAIAGVKQVGLNSPLAAYGSQLTTCTDDWANRVQVLSFEPKAASAEPTKHYFQGALTRGTLGAAQRTTSDICGHS